jgi:hypothetical protein
MPNLLSRRRRLLVTACLCVLGGIAAGSDAAGQAVDASAVGDDSGLSSGNGSWSDAEPTGAACGDGGFRVPQGPFDTPPAASCDPSRYLTYAGDAAETADGPGPSAWAGPAPYDASPPTFAGDIYQFLCIQNPNAATFSYDTVTANYADVAGCKAYDNQGHQSVHDCLCDSCFSLMQQCDALPGCRAIAKCAWDSGCTSANACYLFPPAPCVAPINQAGTGSVSTGLESALSTCGQTNNCPAQ